MDEVVKHGKGLFAIAIAALGVENLICAHVSQVVFTSNPPVVPVLPFVPPVPFLVCLVGIALLAVGVCLAANIRPRFAAILLGLLFLLWALVLLVPKAVARPLDLNIRTCVFEVLALGASALTLAGGLREDVDSSTVRRLFVGKLIAAARYLFAISSIVFGITPFSCSPIHCQPRTGLDPHGREVQPRELGRRGRTLGGDGEDRLGPGREPHRAARDPGPGVRDLRDARLRHLPALAVRRPRPVGARRSQGFVRQLTGEATSTSVPKGSRT